MSVESTTTIAGLNALWPQGTDVKAEGDDHLRLIKSVLKTDAVDKAQFATAVVATAQARSRIANGAIQISQELGTTGSTVNAQHIADQWIGGWSSSSTISGLKQSVTGAGPGTAQPSYLFLSASPAETSAAAGEYVQYFQVIEGIRLSDALLGTSQSKAFVIAFDVNVPVAGTYWVSFGTVTSSHTWLGSYTISAGEVATFVRKTVIIPAGVLNAGTWRIDNSGGAALHFCFHCGATFTGVAGFQSGNFIAGPGQALGLSTATPCYLTNVGLYLDPTNTGKAPPWAMPDEAQELLACQRYWVTGQVAWNGWVTAGQPTVSEMIYFPVFMRTASAIALVNQGVAGVAAAGTTGNLTVGAVRVAHATTAAGTASFADNWSANARM